MSTRVTKQVIQPAGIAKPQVPVSPLVRGGDYVFVAGQVPFDTNGRLVSGEFRAQAEQVLSNLRTSLAAAGCDLSDVVKVNVFLSDLTDFTVFNEVYQQFFEAPFPARTTIGANLLGFLIEVEAIAFKPGG